jgi:hypothetical protein
VTSGPGRAKNKKRLTRTTAANIILMSKRQTILAQLILLLQRAHHGTQHAARSTQHAALIMVLALLLSVPSQSDAAPPTPAITISFSQGPAGGAGQISGSGTYSIVTANSTVSSLTLVAFPTGGGVQGSQSATVGAPAGGPLPGAIGNWNNGNTPPGAVVITNLAAGQYTVFAMAIVKVPGAAQQTVTSASYIVNVTAP